MLFRRYHVFKLKKRCGERVEDCTVLLSAPISATPHDYAREIATQWRVGNPPDNCYSTPDGKWICDYLEFQIELRHVKEFTKEEFGQHPAQLESSDSLVVTI